MAYTTNEVILSYPTMLLNYLKLSLRLLARNPFFTFINVAGLSIGFAVFFILWPFTQAELKSDQFITDHEQIVRVYLDFRWTDNNGDSWGHLNFGVVNNHVGPEMQNHNQIKDYTRFIPQQSFWEKNTPKLETELVASVEGRNYSPVLHKIEHSICADKNFFEFFDIPFVAGDRSTSLNHAESVVVSQTMSKVLFGEEDPIGKLLRVNGSVFDVTGVFYDLPLNSHLQFGVVFSNEGSLSEWNQPSDSFLSHLYFHMKGEPTQITDILNNNKELLIGFFLKKNPHVKIDFASQPLNEIAFSNNFSGDTFKPKSKFTLNILAGVSVIVLVMAWMNYVNLTISKTKARFKEIAARKVSGALLPDLFLQFICQSAVLNLLACLIGLTFIQIVRGPFDYFLNIRIIPFSALDSVTILFFLTILVTGIVATATYPAWVTLRHSTRQLLTKNVPARKRTVTTILTTFQYVAALTMIAWIFVMQNQLNYILHKDLGIEKENTVVFDSPILGLEENGANKMISFAGEITKILHGESVALSGKVCGDAPYNSSTRRVGSDIWYGIDSHGGVDENFIPLYKLKILAGRNFIRDEKKASVILSRFASERLGFKSPEQAVGSFVELEGSSGWKQFEIIGVIEDYRVTPYRNAQGSTEAATGRGQSLTYMNSVWQDAVPERISAKISTSEANHLMAQIEKLYNRTFPGNIFKWYFLDESIDRQYGDQKIIRNQISFFTALAIGVACLGLLGMISNTVVEKTKEISVRRILGAATYHITRLLLTSTVKQISIALFIGIPIAWHFSDQYLEGFTERITLHWWHFVLPLLILVAIMFVTIFTVLWKAARTNPVEALKCE